MSINRASLIDLDSKWHTRHHDDARRVVVVLVSEPQGTAEQLKDVEWIQSLQPHHHMIYHSVW